jgi:Ca2+-binding EF-hand superfamily protein
VKFNTSSLALAVCTAAALALGAAPQAQAQTPGATKSETTKQPKTLRALFNFADKNRDGQLTRGEAKGHLPLTYRDFDKIDKDKRGWINFDQFMAYTNERVTKQADDVIHAGDKY